MIRCDVIDHNNVALMIDVSNIFGDILPILYDFLLQFLHILFVNVIPINLEMMLSHSQVKICKNCSKNHTKLVKCHQNVTSIYHQCNTIIINNITSYHVNAI